MELELIRAQFPQNVMGQLYLNDELLCICIAVNNKKSWSPVSNLPDGRYLLRNHGKGKEERQLKVTTSNYPKPFYVNLGEKFAQETVNYDHDVPLYLTWADGQGLLTDAAEENISRVVAAINKGDKVYLNINTHELVSRG